MSCKVDGMSGVSGGLTSLGSITQYTPNSLFALTKSGGGCYDYFILTTNRDNRSTYLQAPEYLNIVIDEPTLYLVVLTVDAGSNSSYIYAASVNDYYTHGGKASPYAFEAVKLYGVKFS